MQILLLILLIVLAVVVMRGLFNKEWRDASQEKIDALKKERIFWRTLNGFNRFVFDIDAVFTIYLDNRHLATFLTSSFDEDDKDKELKNLISKKHDVQNINIINDALEVREKSVAKIVDEDSSSLTKVEIEKQFNNYKEERLIIPEQYDKFVSYFFNILPHKDGEKYSLANIWEARKKLEEKAGDLEWKSEEVKVDAETLFALKKSQNAIGEVVKLLLTKKVANEKRGALEMALNDWEKLHMLRWCVVDYTVAWQGTNLLQRWFWQGIEVFL